MASEKTLKAKAEIPFREWVEFEAHLKDEVIESLSFKAQGCLNLIESSKEACKLTGKKAADLKWPGKEHWDLLIAEAFNRLAGRFQFPDVEEELCHCRRIASKKVDEAIVLGAHTVEKVREWTSANTACGTCRPEVEKLIAFRLKGR